MPRLSEAKKDVTSCEKPRGGANIPRSADIRMGEPAGSDPGTLPSSERTQGTETSKYLQEKRITMIPRVVASESGGAQTVGVARHRRGSRAGAALKDEVSRTGGKAGPQRVTAP